jgi:hypothetical protein
VKKATVGLAGGRHDGHGDGGDDVVDIELDGGSV